MRRDLIALPDSSKVWVYQSSAPISEEVSQKIKDRLYDFTMQWSSHGKDVESYAHLFHNRFLVMVADETNHVSGCSIDSSVHMIKSLEADFNLNFFDRLNFAYLKEDHVQMVAASDIGQAYADKLIDDETLMFNHLVSDKLSFINDWVIPFKDSWYTKYVNS